MSSVWSGDVSHHPGRASDLPADSAARELRVDIQALRGLAVLLVVLYHAGLGFPKAGYLGVDIFFVVSGFLITSIVAKGIRRGTFSFTAFYLRRAKRLLPAAYVVFLGTALVSPFLLDALELRSYIAQLAGALTFSGNFVLWKQSGYFDGPAITKPLLHVWSLSLEEQYYLLLPAVLLWTPRRLWPMGACLVMVASLALCLALGPIRPAATFFLLPTRLWELAIGSVAAMTAPRDASPVWSRWAFWPALVVVLAVPVFAAPSPAPGIETAAVCVATMVVILRAHPALAAGWLPGTFGKVGDFSYSLYLVHWPLFAFAANAYVADVPVSARMLIVLASLVLAYLLYRLVEEPARRATWRNPMAALSGFVLASLMIASIPWASSLLADPAADYAYVRRVNVGLNGDCEFHDRFVPLEQCATGPQPRVLVWGDSFAMHLVPGIAASSSLPLIQATKSECAPFIGLSKFSAEKPGRAWAEDCLRFNLSVLDYLAATPSVEVVVLSSSLNGYLPFPDKSPVPTNLATSVQGLVEVDASTAATIEALRTTVSRIRGTGKRVVFVGPPPRGDFDIGKCLERHATRKLVLGAAQADCGIPGNLYRQTQEPIIAFLNQVPSQAAVDVIDLGAGLCDTNTCRAVQAGVPLYRDGGHLSYDGSREVGRLLHLGQRIVEAAR